ncbi:uncharacterized protein [Procambarus clarkii]|uniref:uncharacterized protein n=1 Tax=Procambarus clarkii TaxID=6728 RepID=UPI001E671BDD|nr:uncharacterized protein LOC123773640 [Procambarus clarkii]
MKASHQRVVLVALLLTGLALLPASVEGEAGDSSLEDAERPKYDIPTVMKHGGQYYYDLAQSTEEEWTLDASGDSVNGVTATENSSCIVKRLFLEGYVVDEDIFNCSLDSLEMNNTKFHCTQNLTMFSYLNETVNRTYECDEIYCWGAKKYSEYIRYSRCLLKTGLAIWEKYQGARCPQACQSCVWYFKNKTLERVSIDCDAANLTDSTLPTFPRNVHILSLNSNKLRAAETLLNHLKTQTKLEVINLDKNEITAIPCLPQNLIPSLVEFNMQSNQIQELDPKCLLVLLKRRDFAITLKGNPFRCGCNLFHQKPVMLQRFGERITIVDITLLSCINETDNETIPLKFLTGEGCEESIFTFTIDYWILLNVTLVSLNISMIYLILDLALILTNFRGIKSTQRPKMDYVICGIKSCLTYVWGPGGVGGGGGGGLQELEAEDDVEDRVLGTGRSCQRDSCVVRRRTPRPCFD